MGLTATPADQAKLLDLATLDLDLARAHQSLSTLDTTLHLPTLQAAVDEIRGRKHDAMVEVETIRAELARSESDVELVEARIQKDTERLVHTASAKDAQGLEHELESLRKRQSDLEDIELAIMERLENAQNTLSDIDKELSTADDALTTAQDQRQTRGQELRSEIESLGAKRGALASALPADLFELYERQRERYGVGASHLRAGVSSASGVRLTESDLDAIRRAHPDEVLLCPDSSAILVRTPESGV
ncbi:MAG: hypothetical protein RL187_255 [Actinomycetota bacterium]